MSLSSVWRRIRLFSPFVPPLRFCSYSSSSLVNDLKDEGDWFYSSEWWPTMGGQTVFQSTSYKGNGIVTVAAYPSSRPAAIHWPAMERWLQQRKSNPESLYIMQQPHCLAVPYVKSMVSVGLASLACSRYDLKSAVHGKKTMQILCIGHGGGSLPLFLASKIQGAVVHSVEIDPVVISASIQAMGFPVTSKPDAIDHQTRPDTVDQAMWDGIHERLTLYEADAEEFIQNSPTSLYDMVFIDAYDGDDIFPRKLWDPDGLFLKTLETHLNPHHGTVIVNLHADTDALSDSNSSLSDPLLPMGRHVKRVCRAYKEVLGRERGGLEERESRSVGFAVSVPWLQNISLVVCRGFSYGLARAGRGHSEWHFKRDWILGTLIAKSQVVERLLKLPFPCLQYIKKGFVLID
ncbi:uncharacterized protein LOC18444231 isoform X2 [Amborella trichopoda]|uniref:uncharacterized protein LOC18444231 isoform X2 n=1 Tax=Amborella trichopoda TaxID=13333 RepID=UPI0009BE1769|nr:uncharacterized protein LOC18444231 isoform X2 [Amborella trichopoda]|eukprot:XP_020529104.1 uncharacterized protein LOC18444231 isoform X2 [Amborella trichopoda]